MTRVSFYILNEAGEAASLNFACRLAEKAHSEKNTVFIHAQDDLCARLDAMLWTFSQGSFVPHIQLSTAQDDDALTPVVLGSEPPARLDDVLINLGNDVPGFFSRFQRSMEIVTSDNREAARQRYKFYQDRGYELETHKIA